MSEETTGDGPEKKITRLAIGVAGGFNPSCGKQFVFVDTHNIVVLPGFHTYPWPNPKLSDIVSYCTLLINRFRRLVDLWYRVQHPHKVIVGQTTG